LLPILRASSDAVEAAAKALASTPEGTRHYTAVGAIVALMTLGYTDRAIREVLEPIYLGHTHEALKTAAIKRFSNAMIWARSRIGPDDEEVERAMTGVMTSIADAWNARRRPPPWAS
jgi:hypothetical protein